MPIFLPSDLVGRSFLMNTNDDEEKLKAQVVEAVNIYDDKLKDEGGHRKFVCSVNDDKYEEILSYNEILQHIEEDAEIVWSFKRISAHIEPLKRTHPSYKGSKYNIQVKWENG